jgi:Zn-dependent peptidase ImmA (M78 family)
MPRVNPAQLVWARETAGLTREQAASLLKLNASRGKTGAERLAAIEEGEEPTRPQLLAMVKVYRRPLLTFYMAKPPERSERGEDFRTLAAGQRELVMEALLDALLRDIRARQTLVRNILEEDEEAALASFVGSMAMEQGVPAVVDAIRGSLRVTTADLRGEKTAESIFARLRKAVEAQGVFVLLVGDLGSHHTALDVRTFRGFAIADRIAPFIVINDKDAKTAWSFTLLHEMAHLWLGASGISGGDLAGSPIERFCNEVASAFLLSREELLQLSPDLANQPRDPDAVMKLVIRFADARRLSPNLVAYRAFRAGFITPSLWVAVSGRLDQRLQELREQNAKRETAGDGGDFYTTRRHRLGGLVGFTRRALNDGTLTPTKAALVLGVKPHGPDVGGSVVICAVCAGHQRADYRPRSILRLRSGARVLGLAAAPGQVEENWCSKGGTG